MIRPPRLHRPTLTGRVRSDPGLLLLVGLVVALATALTAAVGPLTERTADRAMAATVRDAGLRGDVVATMPEEYDDPTATRDPGSVTEVQQDTSYAQYVLPAGLARVLRPGFAAVTTPSLQVLDAGPGRYLRLAYLDADGPPAVRYTAGRAPRATTRADRDGRWPVQVALSEAAASALGVGPGDRLPAEDEQHRSVAVRVSGVFVATDPRDRVWQAAPELLDPVQGATDGLPLTSTAALVGPESLPDLRLAVPADDLTHRIVFTPRPTELRWRASAQLRQEVVSLQTSADLAGSGIAWDSLLGRVIDDGRAQVASAQGQARVLLVGLLAAILLLLALAAQLLVRRRSGAIAVARERGAALADLAAELLVESLAVTLAGALLGLAVTGLLVGDVGWAWPLPVLVGSVLAAPALGTVVAARSTGRRVPANRAARRTAARAVRLTRLAVEAVVIAAAVLSLVALRQRGAGDATAATAAVWWGLAGCLVVLRLLPTAARLAVRATHRSAGSVRFLLAARLADGGARTLPLLVVAVAVAQLTLAGSLAATGRDGQAAGALLAVGGDARLTTAPDPGVADTATTVAAEPGVRATAAGRVVDGVRVTSRLRADAVRLVVVDATAYARLLASGPLPDAPELSRLRTATGDRVPALLLGGDPDLSDGLVVRWDDANIPLEVVGTAPRVEAATDPVVVVDAAAFAGAGAVAQPDTVWAVGPGADAALTAAAGTAGVVVRYDDVVAARRDAPLASGILRLAVTTTVLLLLVATLGLVLAAAVEAPARASSLGRLRALGLPSRGVRRVLAGELLVPVVVAAATGLALGAASARVVLEPLALERITGQTGAPDLAVPWWLLLVVPLVATAALLVAALEWRRLRRRSLAALLRA